MIRAAAVAAVVVLAAAPGVARADLAQDAQRLLDGTVAAQPTVPGVLADIEISKVSVTVASGSDALPRLAPLPATAVFRYASNTKTYVAAATMRLVEEHRLALDDPIARRLPHALAAIVPHARSITVDMLVHHTSGLYDFASDPDYQAAVLANPARRWTRTEQLRWALAHGHPYGAPGEVFTYSDTGYILLGAIIERATGRRLGDAVPRLLGFDRLGLRETWWEDGRAIPAARQHQYFAQTDLTAANPSFDLYGGGGLIGTAGDLARFWRALFAGRVIRPRSLAELERIPRPARKESAGAGLYRTRIDGRTAWFHAGFWGTLALEIPSEHLTVTVSMGQAQAGAAMFQLAGHLAESAIADAR